MNINVIETIEDFFPQKFNPNEYSIVNDNIELDNLYDSGEDPLDNEPPSEETEPPIDATETTTTETTTTTTTTESITTTTTVIRNPCSNVNINRICEITCSYISSSNISNAIKSIVSYKNYHRNN
jgi:hypothetical protein